MYLKAVAIIVFTVLILLPIAVMLWSAVDKYLNDTTKKQ